LETFFEIIIRLTEAYLFGFGLVYSSFFVFGQSEKLNLFITSFKLIPFIGCLFFLSTICNYLLIFFRSWYSGVGYEQYAFVGYDFIGVFWMTMLFSCLCVFIPTQLFWLKKIKKFRFVVFLLTFFFLFSLERIAIFISAFHRDYLSSSWTMYTGDIFLNIVYSIMIYVLIALLFHYKDNILKFIKLK
jgi:hypothetical protein